MDEKKRKFMDRNFAVASFKYSRWSLDLEEGQTIEDVLQPDNWMHVAPKIMGHDKTNPKGRGDIIEVRKLETGLYAELIITEVGPNFVRTRLLRNQEAVAPSLPDDCPLAVKWNPGKKLHEVIRASDKAVMHPGFQTKDKAIDWIADHLQKLAA